MSKEQVAFCTVVTDEFVLGFIALIQSLRDTHPGFDYEVVVLYNKNLAHLSDENQVLLQAAYARTRLHHVDDENYQNLWIQRDSTIKTPERLKAAFFILEAFSLSQYARVITLDSDMICLKNVSDLLACDFDLGVCQAFDYEENEALPYFNTGVMTIGQKHLTGETYRAILAHQMSLDYDNRRGKADQAVLNDFFGMDGVQFISLDFNITKRNFRDGSISTADDIFSSSARILHFVGEKPWHHHMAWEEQNFSIAEGVWTQYLFRAMSTELLFEYVREINLKLLHSRTAMTPVDKIVMDRKARLGDLRKAVKRSNRLVEDLIASVGREVATLDAKFPKSGWRRFLLETVLGFKPSEELGRSLDAISGSKNIYDKTIGRMIREKKQDVRQAEEQLVEMN